MLTDLYNIFLVPGVGIEPTLHYWNWILNPARLPIPPSGQIHRISRVYSRVLGTIRAFTAVEKWCAKLTISRETAK